MIQYQILQIDIIRIVCQTVRRITNEILGVEGLKDQSLSTTLGGGGGWETTENRLLIRGDQVNFVVTEPKSSVAHPPSVAINDTVCFIKFYHILCYEQNKML